MYICAPSEAVAYGCGELHLAVGQGSITVDDGMANCRLPAATIFNVELNERYFADEAGLCVAASRHLMALAGAAQGGRP